MLIAGPNLTIDRTLRLARLRPGEVLRARDAHAGPGGKGVNVVRTALALGRPAELVAFVPRGRSGQAVAGWLDDAGVPLTAVPVDGEVRSAAVILEDSGRTTVLNEPGPPADERAWEQYHRAVASRLADHRVLACCGSTPPGSPPGAYADLVSMAADQDVAAIVDATGDTLATALEARPRLVAPNLAEAEQLLTGSGDHAVAVAGRPTVRRRALAAAAALVQRGAQAALVTAGVGGLAFVDDGDEGSWLEAPPVAVRNEIGAGDALVAGVACALEQGEPLERALLAGLAAAGATVEQQLPGRLDSGRAAELEHQLTGRG